MDWLQVGTLFVLTTAALFAGWQVWEARNDRRERQRPFVVVDFETVASIFVELEVSSIGATPARDVVVQLDREPESALDGGRWHAAEAALFGEGVPLMPPQRRIRMLFDRVPDRIEAGLPMRYVATVTYEGDNGQRYQDVYPLDLGARCGFKSILIKGSHEVAEELQQIRRLLAK